MLIALYTIFILSGGGTFGPMVFIDEALDNTRTAIVDDDRRKEAIVTLKAMKSRTRQYTKAIKAVSKDMDSSMGGYEFADEEIDAIWDRYFDLNTEYSKDIVEIRFQLRDQITREEWEAIFPAPVSSN